MINKKARHIICIIICISMLASQTLISIGSEKQSTEQSAISTTESAINENISSNPIVHEEDESVINSNNDEDVDSSRIEEDLDSSGSQVLEEDLDSSENQTLEDELKLIEEKTDDHVKGAEFNGYIVEIKEDLVDEVIVEEKEKVIEDEIKEDILVVQNPEDVVSFVSASAIENISPNYKLDFYAYPEDTNDKYYSSQWGLKHANVNSIWKAGKTGANVNVAIIDTGLNIAHEDIDETKVKVRMNLVNPSRPTTDITDFSGSSAHGSLVTSIIAAKTNNGKGIAGVTDDVNIYFYKVFGANDEGGEVSNLIAAYEAILASGVRIDVLNLSVGHPGSIPAEEKLVKQIIAKGTIVVAAAGNDGTKAYPERNQFSYPAGYADVIGVGSIDSNGAASSFSTKNSSVDVAAPGGSIIAVAGTGTADYVTRSGTSFSCPLVASAAVAVKQTNRNINSRGFRDALAATSKDVGVTGKDNTYGYGLLNVSALMNYFSKKDGWEYTNGNYYYYKSGVMQKGWLTISGKKYYLAANGAATTGWARVGSSWYYFNPATREMKTGWLDIGAKKYYLSSAGILQSGWITHAGQRYYLNSGGVAQYGWVQIGRSWYYFDPRTAIMKTGMVDISGRKYYLSSAGILQSGWITHAGKRYYLNSGGAVQYGWTQIGRSWYYFDSKTAIMKTGWLDLGGKKYYLSSAGILQSGWITHGGQRYYLNSGGVVQYGWTQIGRSWYYFDPKTAIMKTGWLDLGGKKYYLSSAGVLQSGWVTHGGQRYYLNSNGVVQYGWVQIGSSWYYFDTRTAIMKAS